MPSVPPWARCPPPRKRDSPLPFAARRRSRSVPHSRLQPDLPTHPPSFILLEALTSFTASVEIQRPRAGAGRLADCNDPLREHSETFGRKMQRSHVCNSGARADLERGPRSLPCGRQAFLAVSPGGGRPIRGGGCQSSRNAGPASRTCSRAPFCDAGVPCR